MVLGWLYVVATLPITFGDEPAASERTAPQLLPGEAGPVTYLLEDQSHKLQPVLGFKFEDFIKLLAQQAGEQKPQKRNSYAIEEANVEVNPGANTAEVSVELSIRCYQSDWTSVPLRMVNLTLRQARHDGPGEGDVRVAEQDGNFDGYVGWLKTPTSEKLAEQGELHKLRLSLLAPLQQQSGATQVNLNLPLAGHSEIRLRAVPSNQGNIMNGSYLPIVESQREKVDFLARGQGGPVTLSWGKSSAAHPAGKHLDARSDIVASYSEGSVLLNSTIHVSSVSGPISHFQVHLPVDALPELVPQPGFVCTVQESKTEAAGQPSAGPIVDVRLEQPTESPRPLQLTVRLSLALKQEGQTVELSGWDVPEATRQHGHVFIQGGGSQQLVWHGARGLSQVDEPPAGTNLANLLTVFEFYQPSWALQLSANAPRARLRVQPEHHLEIRDEQLALRATWHCFLRGAGLRELRLQLGGWEFDDIEPESLLTQGDNLADQGEFRLLLPPAIQGAFDITLTAHQPLSRGATSTEVGLPSLRKPLSGEVNFVENSGTFQVRALEKLELQPDMETTVGLESQPSREGANGSEGGEWLYKLTGTAVKYAARWQVRPRQMSVETGGRVEIQPPFAKVKQTLRFDVAFEPLDTLWLTAPRQLPRDQWEITSEGSRLAITETSDLEADPQRVLLRVPLPRSRLGKFEIGVTFAVPLARLEPASASLAEIPLVAPRQDKEVTVRPSTLEIVTADGIVAALHGGGWNASASPSDAGGTTMTILSREGSETLPLTVTRLDDTERSIVVVTAAYVQTRLSGNARDEQLNVRCTTTSANLLWQLPLELSDSDLTIKLDGQPVTWTMGRDHQINIPLSASTNSSAHDLELRYQIQSPPTLTHLVLPRIAQRHTTRNLYWEVELPASEHWIGATDDAYSPLMEWRGAGLAFTRQPTAASADLLAAAGGSQFLLSATGNRYLFRGDEGLVPLGLQTLHRATWVLLTSGLALGLGLMLLYLPAVRQAKFLLAASVLGTVLVLLWTDLAILAAQGGSLGVALAALAAMLARWIQPTTIRAALPAQNHVTRNSRVRFPSVSAPAMSGSTPTISLPMTPPPPPEAQP
jgi:hypothetical protein